ncbi:MAG: quinol dehydrogenase ferredoxin subunit NapH [Candidatus Electrothrix aestuarii]|uniref:Quinol dehydrogenase ferredoxin subunit NapH n=1 Tax=Candidatus Electrothrix aestuarii TaxID=3062594 RepID=A0AAU8LW80_9BACT|nr:quinol dehydrogenase ferredoxin subunit NapH [Candidatus Electrothrix aestuarii]
MIAKRKPGQEAVEKKGWVDSHKWLLLRRVSQVGILALFLAGPLCGIWIIRGTLSASEILGFLPMTDPLIMLQSLAAGHPLASSAVVGVLVVVVMYVLLGGGVFCAWVCPVNVVTDAAAWLNRVLERKSGINQGLHLNKNIRYWFIAAILLLSLGSGTIVYEWLNPVTMLQRGILFGMGIGWILILAIFVFDAFLLRRGWCGHLCPMGAMYSLLTSVAVLRVKADGRERCTDCLDCFAVCPEPQVIRPALKGAPESSPLILDKNCLNCGRCIDICPHNVFRFSRRT